MARAEAWAVPLKGHTGRRQTGVTSEIGCKLCNEKGV